VSGKAGKDGKGGKAETLCPDVPALSALPDGGAGNRTLVRVSIQNCVYVCRLDFMPSLQSGIEPTSLKPIS
jgi:hypothetical protein